MLGFNRHCLIQSECHLGMDSIALSIIILFSSLLQVGFQDIFWPGVLFQEAGPAALWSLYAVGCCVACQ